MKNFKKGFTLIELLVVVAIIGILASVVLASLNGARNKGKIASAEASMSSMRAQAELVVTAAGTYPALICGTTAGNPLATLIAAVDSQSGGTVSCTTPTANGDGTFNSWAASVDVDPSATTLNFCVDSTGFSGTGKTALAGVCS